MEGGQGFKARRCCRDAKPASSLVPISRNRDGKIRPPQNMAANFRPFYKHDGLCLALF